MTWIQSPGSCYPGMALQIQCGLEHIQRVREARARYAAQTTPVTEQLWTSSAPQVGARAANPPTPLDEAFFAPAGPVYGKFDWMKRYAPVYTHPMGSEVKEVVMTPMPTARAANPINPAALLPLIMVAGRRDSSRWRRIAPSTSPSTPAGLFCPKGQYLYCKDGPCRCVKGVRAWKWWEKRPSPLYPNPVTRSAPTSAVVRPAHQVSHKAKRRASTSRAAQLRAIARRPRRTR